MVLAGTHTAALRGGKRMSAPDALGRLKPKFHAARGTMQWYCIDYWSRELGLDIARIKRAALDQVGYLPGAEEFLLKLKESGKRRVLVTNAHPTTLAIKDQQVRLTAHFDACYSTPSFRCAKGRCRLLAAPAGRGALRRGAHPVCR